MNIFKKILSSYFWDTNRQTKDRNLLFVGADTDAKKELTSYDRRTMVRLSRYLVRNNGVVKGAIRDMALYSVGCGIMPQAKTDNETWNDAAEKAFAEWAATCDIRGAMTLTELCYSWSKAIDTDGDVFILPATTKDGAKLQTIPAHRIYWNEQGRNIYDGVQLDSTDKPVAYILDDNKRRISAFNLIHVFEGMNSDGIRCEPSTAHAINNMFDVREILGLEKKGVKLNSAIATVIKTPLPTESAGFLGRKTETTSQGQASTLESIMGGGIIPRLAPGEDIQSFTSSRPSPTFDGFIEHFIRDFCVGIGLPFEYVWNTQALGGTAQRFILEKAQRRFEQRQKTLEKALTKVWQFVVGSMIQSGQLPNNPQFYRVEWQTPKKITVDAGRISNATIEEIKMGLTTYKADYASRGLDYRTELRERALEEKYIAELAKEMGVAPQAISQRTPNMNEMQKPTEKKESKTEEEDEEHEEEENEDEPDTK